MCRLEYSAGLQRKQEVEQDIYGLKAAEKAKRQAGKTLRKMQSAEQKGLRRAGGQQRR